MERTGDFWESKAECKNADPELFFPIGETSDADKAQIKKAGAYCLRCFVQEDCLDYALTTNQDTGVWGGMSANQRRALKRRAVILRRRAE